MPTLRYSAARVGLAAPVTLQCNVRGQGRPASVRQGWRRCREGQRAPRERQGRDHRVAARHIVASLAEQEPASLSARPFFPLRPMRAMHSPEIIPLPNGPGIVVVGCSSRLRGGGFQSGGCQRSTTPAPARLGRIRKNAEIPIRNSLVNFRNSHLQFRPPVSLETRSKSQIPRLGLHFQGVYGEEGRTNKARITIPSFRV